MSKTTVDIVRRRTLLGEAALCAWRADFPM